MKRETSHLWWAAPIIFGFAACDSSVQSESSGDTEQIHERQVPKEGLSCMDVGQLFCSPEQQPLICDNTSTFKKLDTDVFKCNQGDTIPNVVQYKGVGFNGSDAISRKLANLT